MMKKLLFGALCVLSVAVSASQPTDIRFLHKETTFFGQKYSVYIVRCSNGSGGKISSWDDGAKWCVGTSKSDCVIDNKNAQLEVAKKTCS